MNEVILFIKKDALKDKYEEYKNECMKKYCQLIGYDKPIEIQKEIQGKPYIKNNPFYFNVSHSYDYYIIAFFNSPIGIDIEKHRDRNYHYIAKRYYNDSEFSYINHYGREAFFDLWCMKESYTKYLGESIFNHLKVNMVKDNKLITSNDKCYFYKLDIDNEYSCFIASEKETTIKEIFL